MPTNITYVFQYCHKLNLQDSEFLMKQFEKTYEFQHITLSPYCRQANGLAERVVRTMKELLEHLSDPYKALL